MRAVFFLLILFGLHQQSTAQQLIHYWHFNTVSGTVDSVAADVFAGAQAPLIIYRPAFSSVQPINRGYMDNVAGDTTNARLAEPAGQGIRPRNPSDSMELFIQLPSTGFQNLQISYALQRSGSGMLKQVLYYSADGINYTAHPDTVFVTTAWNLVQFNLGMITALANNPDMSVKIRFFEQNVASNGNNRIDNFVLEGSPVSTSTAQLIHYWHFNGVSGNVDSVASNVYPGTQPGFLYYQPMFPGVVNPGIMDNVTGDTINARMSEPAGQGIRPRNPSDSMELYIPVPTSGFDNIRLSYAVQRSGSGMLKQVLFYTTDGTNYVPHPDTVFVGTAWALVNFDLSALSAVSNNPQFALKLRFYEQNIASNGNNRLDNFVVEGNPLGGQVTGVSISPTALQLVVADSAQLNATVLPTSASNQNVSWTSSDATVASVDSNGVVRALAAGTSWIIVTTNDGGFSDSCQLSVANPARLTIQINDQSNTALVGAEVIIGNDTLLTSATGIVVFSLLPASYQVSVRAPGYFPLDTSWNLTADTAIILTMTELSAVVHYWHFNNLAIGTVLQVPADFSLFPNPPAITYVGTGSGYMDDFSPGSIRNAQFNEPAGAALRVRNRSHEKALIIPLPSTGCSDIRLSFDIHRSGQGMLTNVFEYTLDGGTTYQTAGINPQTIPVTETYTTHVIDFSGVTGANDNPNFGVRITWIGNTEQENGNNRYDNITMMATTSSTTSVTESQGILPILYPNPTTGTFRLKNVASATEYRIINLQGQLVMQGITGSSDELIAADERLENGIYFLMLSSANSTKVLRFVVQK
ncbi:MAG: Ig-like domain-containing protein [Bacteroidia bacterium]